MGIINSEFKPVSVRESLTDSFYIFPRLSQLPQVQFQSYDHLIEISYWCDMQFGHENWYRVGSKWFFSDQDQLIFFKLTWT